MFRFRHDIDPSTSVKKKREKNETNVCAKVHVLQMAQKQLAKGKKPVKLGKKGPAVNRHGKKATQKKGKFNLGGAGFAGGYGRDVSHKDSLKITASVNEKNELEAARKATSGGGKMLVVRPPPDAEAEVRGPKPKKSGNKGPVIKMKVKKADRQSH